MCNISDSFKENSILLYKSVQRLIWQLFTIFYFFDCNIHKNQAFKLPALSIQN